MTRRHVVMIVALSLIWGSSFMFIKVAVRSFDPSAVVWLRLVLSCLVVVPAAFLLEGRRVVPQALAAWRPLVLLGAINFAVPMIMITWAETRIDSGLAGILQAVAPIVSAVISIRFGGERVSGLRLVGVLIGFGGVALLLGSPGHGGLLAAFAVVLASAGYAVGTYVGAHTTVGTSPIVVAAGAMTAATLMAMPFGIAKLPAVVPGWKEVWSLVALGVVCTGVANIIAYELLSGAGASRTILVTYLIPGVAVLYGVLLLGEPLRPVAVVALALILGGVGLAGRGRRVPVRGTG